MLPTGGLSLSSTLSLPRPTTDAELLDLVEFYLGVRIPDKACCKGHTAPARAFCDAYFARYPWMVWKAARGLGGKSFMLAVLAWIESVTLQCSVSLLGGSGHQSANVHEYLRGFWMKPSAPIDALKDDTTASHIRLTWGNVVKALTASQTSVRGPHPERVRMDEVDEMEWGICSAARGQALTKGDVLANTVFSSTHQNADGTLTKLITEANEKGMPVYEWCYKETLAPHGWLTAQSMDRYKMQLTAETWRVEVELGEPSPEGRAIMPECVESMFSLATEVTINHDTTNEKVIMAAAGELVRDQEGVYFELEAPVEGAAYATGSDWGKQDETVHVTFRTDVYPMRLVAYEHLQRRPMPWMIGRLMARLRRFPGDALHDATGPGTWHSDEFEEPVDNFVMVGKARADLFADYITAIERGEVQSPRLMSLYHAHKFCRNKDLYSAEEVRTSEDKKKGHPPDPFVAAALAYRAGAQPRMGLVSATADRPAMTTNAPSSGPSAMSMAMAFLRKKD